MRVLDDPSSPDEEFHAACRWLEGYAESDWYRHRVSKLWFSAESAGRKRAEANASRDDRAWSEAIGTGGPVPSENLKWYLTRYPNGAHAGEAHRRLADNDRHAQDEARHRAMEQERTERREAITRLRKQFEAARPLKSVDKLELIIKTFWALPLPALGVETDDDRRTRDTLRDDLYAALKALSSDATLEQYRREWVRRKLEIDQDVEALDLKKAATNLRHCSLPLPEVDQYRRAFGGLVVGVAERRVSALIEKRDWDEPIGRLQGALDDTDFLALTPDQEHGKKLRVYLGMLKRAKDASLYEAFRRVQTKENAKAYLDHAPLKTMQPVVEAFINWENARFTEQVLTVDATITWGTWADDKPVGVEIWVGPPGPNWFKHGDIAATSKENQTTGPHTSAGFRAKPSDPLGVWVVIERTGPGPWVGSDKLKAEVKLDGKTAEELAQGVSEKVTMTVGSNRGTSVTVKVNGTPARPPVGEWKETDATSGDR